MYVHICVCAIGIHVDIYIYRCWIEDEGWYKRVESAGERIESEELNEGGLPIYMEELGL